MSPALRSPPGALSLPPRPPRIETPGICVTITLDLLRRDMEHINGR
jgi:hypothetical protein